MDIRAIDEYNAEGHLLWAESLPGAFARGRSRAEAVAKLPREAAGFLHWLTGERLDPKDVRIIIAGEKLSELRVCDADSDLIFPSERLPLTAEEYESLKGYAFRSAEAFLALYESIPDKLGTTLTPRSTFYGEVPITAEAMYLHTRNVNSYYFGEIGIEAGNEPDILACRAEGFRLLEEQPNHLVGQVLCGSYGEEWSVRKVMRRFVWHDRIHARAMYRMACSLCGAQTVNDTFGFAR